VGKKYNISRIKEVCVANFEKSLRSHIVAVMPPKGSSEARTFPSTLSFHLFLI
jgi:hypothetical protein